MSESTISVSYLLLYFTSTAPHACTLPRHTFNWYQSRWEASTAPQGHRGHVLRLRSNLVSAESSVTSAYSARRVLLLSEFESGLISGPVWPPQVIYSQFRAIPALLQVLRFLQIWVIWPTGCRYRCSNRWIQVEDSLLQATGEDLQILHIADFAAICCHMHFLMYKILWVWFSDIPPLRLLHLQSLWLMYDLMRLNVSAVICA